MKRHTEAMTVRARASTSTTTRVGDGGRRRGGGGGRARVVASSANTRAARVVVEVFWDVDTLCPSEGCEREVARRLTRAASAFGDVRRCRAFANEETMSRISLERAVGVETTVVDASGMGDDVDDALAAAAAAFAREGAETTGAETTGAETSAFRFSTRRRRRAMEMEAVASEEAETEATREAARWSARAKDARSALPSAYARDETVEAIVRGRSRVAVIVTSDNDMTTVMDYLSSHGVAVVVIGNFANVPRAAGGMKTKTAKTQAKSMGTSGMTKEYWEVVKRECEKRELSRLKLLQSCDGALLFDPNRTFDDVAGEIVGVWFPARGSGVGRWYG